MTVAQRPRRLRAVAAAAGSAMVLAAVTGALRPLPASASPTVTNTITVSTTGDTVDGDTSSIAALIASQGADGRIGLREAILAANNTAGHDVVEVPPGTYTLGASGALRVGTGSGSDISITGTGTAVNTIIASDGTHRVLSLDPNLVGNVTVAISGVTISGGRDEDGLGGAGIIAGNPSPADTTTLSDCVVSGNTTSSTTATNAPGGGIQYLGGSLSIDRCTISGNASGSSPGGGLDYETLSPTTGTLSLTNSTISGNSLSNGDASAFIGGGGVHIQAIAGSTVTLSGDTFANNTATGTSTGPVGGGGLWLEGSASITSSTFTSNAAGGAAATFAGGGAIAVSTGTVGIHFARITGNTATHGPGGLLNNGAEAVTDAANSWWGCNAGPGGAGCDTATEAGTGSGSLTLTPRLQLTASASATNLLHGGTSSISASLTENSASADTSGSGHVLDGTPVGFAATLGGVSPAGQGTAGGAAGTTFTAGSTDGAGGVGVTVDNQLVDVALNVGVAPAITSANGTTFIATTPGTFTVTATGVPAATFSESGSLPAGVTLSAAGLLSGTATATGSYPITITAHNGFGSDATQSFTLSVNPPTQAPAITSAGTASFTEGVSGSFTVTATGIPTPTLGLTGALPPGLSFDGATGVLSGTPAANSHGTYLLTQTAANGVAPDASAGLTLTLGAPPEFTSANTTTFTAGGSGTFQVSASGFPAPAITESGPLPSGVTFDMLAGVLSGTPAAGTGGSYSIVFTASNGVAADATQAFVLTVDAAPQITSAAATTFTAGAAGSFTVTATGTPAPSLSMSGTLPAGVSFDTATGVLSGTATGSGASYALDITATNGVGSDAVQHFTLTVDRSPAITSAGSTTFEVGVAGTFTVTAGGFPAPTLGESGALPTGVTFDSATGALAGTPGAGTAGDYALTFSASNGVDPAASQSFTLHVDQPPAITSQNAATFTTGSAGTFTVSASGFPAPTLGESGSLPGGVTFDGATGTLAGTPADGTGGSYTVTFTASNGVAPDATQSFTLTVDQAPAITSANAAAFTTGVSGSFQVTATGYPAPTLGVTGALPGGVTFDSATGVLSGTPAGGTQGVYPLTVTAGNGVGGDAGQAFTLTVRTTTLTTLASSNLHVLAGQPLTLTATVTAASGAPTGTVTFLDGSTPIGTGTLALSGGVMTATLTTGALTVATHSITAGYGGDTTHAGSTSAALSQVVASVATVTVTPHSHTLRANGVTHTPLAVVVTDSTGQPVAGDTVSFASTPSGGVTFSVPTAITDGTGSATITMTSTTRAQPVTITVIESIGNVSGTATEKLLATRIRSRALVTDHIPANGTSTAVAMVTLVDGAGNPVQGETITFSTEGSAGDATLAHPTVDTDASGVAADTVTSSTTPNREAITVSDNGSEDPGQNFATTLALTQTPAGGSTPTSFIHNAYVTLLGRDADPAAVAYWLDRMSHGMSRAAVGEALASSAEFRSQVIGGTSTTPGLYQLYLGRPSDPGGVAFWVAEMAAGMSFEQVRLGFLASPEYPLHHPGGPGAVIDALYEDVLGRPSDPGGRAYWLANYDAATIAAQFIGSSEGRAQLVSTLYRAILDRAPDGIGLAHWTQQLLNGATDEQIIGALLGSDEYLQNH